MDKVNIEEQANALVVLICFYFIIFVLVSNFLYA